MILKDLKVFLQNVQKNNFLINTVLEVNYNFDIIFIQEPLWITLRTIPSSENLEGIPLLGVSSHPNWLIFARELCSPNDSPRVLVYINIRLSFLYFFLRKDIFNHRDILLVSFFNNNSVFWILNIYSDSLHSALKYLKDTEVNILNLLIMTGDFNIRDNIWDPSFPHHLVISDDLMTIVDSFNLELSFPTNHVSTRYSDLNSRSNSVIYLMFLRSRSTELNNHQIYPDLHLSLDHVSLSVMIAIENKNINEVKYSIAKNSEEEANFIKEVSIAIKKINISDLSNISKLEEVVNSLTSSINSVWNKNSKHVKITKYSKSWWNEEYNCALNNYRTTRSLKDWKTFKSKVKSSKHNFFDTKIQEIANKRCGLWELMNWVKKYKLPAIEAIKYNGQQCLELGDL